MWLIKVRAFLCQFVGRGVVDVSFVCVARLGGKVVSRVEVVSEWGVSNGQGQSAALMEMNATGLDADSGLAQRCAYAGNTSILHPN